MTEPDWTKFRLDLLWDNPGAQQRKRDDFMHAFIDWREGLRNVSVTIDKPRKQPNRAKRKRQNKGAAA